MFIGMVQKHIGCKCRIVFNAFTVKVLWGFLRPQHPSWFCIVASRGHRIESKKTKLPLLKKCA